MYETAKVSSYVWSTSRRVKANRMSQVVRSRTFVIFPPQDRNDQIYFLVKLTIENYPAIVVDHYSKAPQVEERYLIQLLLKGGMTVRSYSKEEKCWFDESQRYGVVRAPGSKDGTWGIPTLEEFDREYLAII